MHPDLTKLLATVSCVIGYEPLRSEVALSVTPTYVIPQRPSLDPIAEAVHVQTIADNTVALLIPGRRFDATGTRHGQGGGWYDRFLAEIPRSWIRIGVCYDDQFSPTPLLRQEWDQPMDYVYVVGREHGSGTLYSSHGVTP